MCHVADRREDMRAEVSTSPMAADVSPIADQPQSHVGHMRICDPTSASCGSQAEGGLIGNHPPLQQVAALVGRPMVLSLEVFCVASPAIRVWRWVSASTAGVCMRCPARKSPGQSVADGHVLTDGCQFSGKDTCTNALESGTVSARWMDVASLRIAFCPLIWSARGTNHHGRTVSLLHPPNNSGARAHALCQFAAWGQPLSRLCISA